MSQAPITLFHHPRTRAANVVWMLEELEVPYELVYVDLAAGAHLGPEHGARNPMHKLPVIFDGEARVTETAAIGVYLADRYGLGTLAPALDDPRRGTYLRWAFMAPGVVEPACMARAANWTFTASNAGWGRWEDLLTALREGLTPGPYLLGDQFTMADVILGGTLRWMLLFKMIDADPVFVAYAQRLAERPALLRANARNAQVVAERGLAG